MSKWQISWAPSPDFSKYAGHSEECSVWLPTICPLPQYHVATCDCGYEQAIVDEGAIQMVKAGMFYTDNKGDADLTDDRQGEWMHTSLGGRFYPADPRESEIFISDIANGLALDCRYGGQGRVDKFYSVAEHSVLMAQYAARELCWPADALKCILLHDAAEAYLNDLPRAVKHAVGASYDILEERIQTLVYRKYGLTARATALASQIKEIDCRIVPSEKAAIMTHPQPWNYDKYVPLPGVKIECWSPQEAKGKFLNAWCRATTGMHSEDIVYD